MNKTTTLVTNDVLSKALRVARGNVDSINTLATGIARDIYVLSAKLVEHTPEPERAHGIVFSLQQQVAALQKLAIAQTQLFETSLKSVRAVTAKRMREVNPENAHPHESVNSPPPDALHGTVLIDRKNPPPIWVIQAIGHVRELRSQIPVTTRRGILTAMYWVIDAVEETLRTGRATNDIVGHRGKIVDQLAALSERSPCSKDRNVLRPVFQWAVRESKLFVQHNSRVWSVKLGQIETLFC